MTTNRTDFIKVSMSLATYEARVAKYQAEIELAAAQTIEKMIQQGFTEEEINSILMV